MHTALPALIFLFPFLSAILMPIVGRVNRRLCQPVTVLALGGMGMVSLLALIHLLQRGPIRYPFGGWAPPLGIEWVLDGLSSILTLLLSFIGMVVAVYAGPTVHKKLPTKVTPFYTLVLFLMSGLTGMVLAGDFFNLFVFLEVASLSGYALVAVGEDRALLAAFRYLILGTIGASFYLLGVGYLYAATGTLNMADLSQYLSQVPYSKTVLLGLAFIAVGLSIKMALFPLHGWLPDAYAYAPDAVSTLMAPLVTKVPLYALIRIAFWVLGVEALRDRFPLMVFLGWMGASATIAGTILAFMQPDFKRMLAYFSVSEIGLIMVGISVVNPTALTGAILHIINHAFMMACLFSVAGAAIHRHGIGKVFELSQLRGKMPWTLTAFTIAFLSMIGIPPTGGFFSKWHIILGAIEARHYLFASVIVGSSLLTALYFFRVIQKTFFDGNAKLDPPPLSWWRMEAPPAMLFGMGIFALGILLLGIFNAPIISILMAVALPRNL